MSKRTVIIGAGPGGLASALLLAATGSQVTLLERLPRVGGRTSGFEAEGFRFDLGPTFFLYPVILEEIFRRVGRDLWQEVDLVRLDPQYRVQFGQGGELDASPNIPRMEEAIAKMAPGDAAGFRQFLKENRRKLKCFEPCLETSFQGWSSVLNGNLLKLLPMLRPHQSLDRYLKRFFRDPRIRLAFSFQSKYLGMSPFRCPSLFSILSFLEYEYGVFHPVGGCGALMETMADIARDMGVEIRLNEPVTGLDFEGRRVRGVWSEGGYHGADAVVVNADFARFMTRFVPDKLRPSWSDRRIAKKQFSCSTFMLYLGIEGSYDLPHHNIYISEDYARNLEEIEIDHVLPSDPSFYVQNACVTDANLAPKGHSTLYILVPVPHQHANIDWEKEELPFREQVLDQVEKVGIKGVRDRIRFERRMTPAHWDRDMEIHKGATFNLAHSLGQLLHRRPHNRFEEIEGLYLVGGGTHPGSGLPVIFESAKITAELIRNDLGLADLAGDRRDRELQCSQSWAGCVE